MNWKYKDVPVEAQQLRLWHCIRGGGGGCSGRPTPPAGARSPINMSEMFQRAPAAFHCLMFYLFEIPLFYATKCSPSLSVNVTGLLSSLWEAFCFVSLLATGCRCPATSQQRQHKVDTLIHACIHTRIHTDMHKYACTCIHMHAHIHTYIQYIGMRNMHACMHTYTLTYIQTCINMRAHTVHTHAQHACMHMHIHT